MEHCRGSLVREGGSLESYWCPAPQEFKSLPRRTFLKFFALEKTSFQRQLIAIRMKWRGQKPVPPGRPCALRWCRITCSGVIVFGGSHSDRGGETPRERSDLLRISTEPIFQFSFSVHFHIFHNMISGNNRRNIYILHASYVLILGRGTVRNFHEEVFHPCFLVVILQTL